MIVIRRPDQFAGHRFRCLRHLRPSGLLSERAERDLQELRVGHLCADDRRPGGCNPIPLESRVEGDQLVIPAAKLLGGAGIFRTPN